MSYTSPQHAPLSFRVFVALVAALMGLNAVAIDMMLPGFPDITNAFGLSDPNRAQVVITIYMIGFGLGQLAMGVLADRYGRKPVLMAGLIVYILAALACVIAPSFEMLLVARFVQGLGSASPRVISVASVRDCYDGRRMAEVMSLSMMVFMAVPVLAPSLGQLVLFVAPWQGIFIALALYAALMLVFCALKMPETLRPEHRREIRISVILQALKSIFGSRQTMGYTLASGTMFGALLGFVNSAQQILGVQFELGAKFPLVFAFIAFSISVSSFINSRLVQRYGMRMLSHASVCAFVILSAIMLIFADGISLWGLLPLLSLIMLLVGMVFSNFNSLAMEEQGAVAGIASSIIGSITVLMAAAGGYFVGAAYDGTIVPLALGYLIGGIGTIILLLWTERGRLFRAVNQPSDAT